MNEDTFLALTMNEVVPDGATICVEDDETKTVYWKRSGDKIEQVTCWKNVSAVLEANLAEAKEFSRTGKLSELVKVASVPIGLHYDWKAKGYTEDPVKMARLLNDPDFAKLRTNTLRV
ncbi:MULTISPECIES: hypothetical protein [unclassified Rhizobium]|uniref:hypothetical protein n=1 Tax=unclassified Rhizobium TaxID=2613769 RepID=UPI001160C5F5|nr:MULTISPECIES: hypothetical protein [unclassified Rhizobium]TQX87143.1 hypothetical protein EQW76_14880 [Rhizobium sp. rho-13.1]TQY14234.1 hypothetical protein EQW74_13740 [Rhizobium sp. rho-1.1]